MNVIEKIELHGKPYVAIPAADYDRIVEIMEDNGDAKAIEETLRALKEGRLNTLPAKMVYDLADAKTSGERIRIWRIYNAMTQAELGKATGRTPQSITMIEGNKRKLDVDAASDFAAALHCCMSDIF